MSVFQVMTGSRAIVLHGQITGQKRDANGVPASTVLWECDHPHSTYEEAEQCAEAEARRRFPEANA